MTLTAKDIEGRNRREAINIQFPCDLCRKRPRYRTLKVCSTCSNHVALHGHWKGSAIPKKDMLLEMETAGQLVAKNLDHPAIVSWQRLFEEWIKQAKAAPAVTPGGRWVADFQGTEAIEVLTIILAYYLKFYVDADRRIPDVKSLYYHCANRAIFFFFPRSLRERQKVKQSERGAVALLIQQHLGGLLAAFVEAHLAKENYREEQKRLLEAKPLEA